MPLAAVIQQKRDEILDVVRVDRVDNPLAFAPAREQPAALQNGQVAGKRRRRDVERLCDLSGWPPFGARSDDEAEDLQAKLVTKGGKLLCG